MVDGFSCILDFQNFPGVPLLPPPHTLIKGIQLNPQSRSPTTAAKSKKRVGKPSPIKTIYKKMRRALGQDLFVWFVIGLFETLICAIPEVCDSCIVNSWALLIFLLCLWWPNSNFLCCVITQTRESSRDLLSVTNRKALAPGGWGWEGRWGHSPPPPHEPPFKTLITLLPVTFS